VSPKPVKNIDDPRYVRALGHPLRVRILAMLEEGTASPRELAPRLGATLGTTAYHVRTLHRLGLIKLVERTRVRGAVQNHYRARERPQVSDEAWHAAPPAAKQALLGATLLQILDYASASAAAGGFDRSDAHLSRTTTKVDAQGWQELVAAFLRLLDDIARIEDGVDRRGAPSDELRDVGAVLMLFDAVPFMGPTGGGEGG
jgi:DNA-binding transcriptional ArsR family regulator